MNLKHLATVLSLLPVAVVADEQSSALAAMGAYVTTDDMAGSETFYRILLASTPVIQLPDFVAFNVEGGWFAIVSRHRYAPNAQAGSGAVPYLQANDLGEIRDRFESATGSDAPKILREPGIHILKLTDPNGKLIEFFHFPGS